MKQDMQILAKVVAKVVHGRLTRRDAAKILGVSMRSIHNYVTKFLESGPGGLRDRRQGHFHKIGPEEEMWIVTYKLDGPHRSARWIRDRLKLPVSTEAVRRVLVKHHLDHSNLLPRKRDSASSSKWDPF